MMMPDTVHDDSSSQWIRRVCDSIGQIHPAAPCLKKRRLGISEHRKEMARNRFAEIVGIAALVQRHVARLLHISEDVKERILLWQCLLCTRELNLQTIEAPSHI